MHVMDSRDHVLRCKTERLVKVLWQHRGVEEATWEHEDMMRTNYPFLFEDDGTLFNHLVVMTDACECDCVYMCVNFGDKILLGGKNMKTRVNLKIFAK